MDQNELNNTEEEPISLVDDDDSSTSTGSGGISTGKSSSVRTFGTGAAKLDQKAHLNRPLNKTNTGATRCRIFHSKVAVASLLHMENQINEWIDHEEIDIKHVGHLVGVMEGKSPEPNVIVVAWF